MQLPKPPPEQEPPTTTIKIFTKEEAEIILPDEFLEVKISAATIDVCG